LCGCKDLGSQREWLLEEPEKKVGFGRSGSEPLRRLQGWEVLQHVSVKMRNVSGCSCVTDENWRTRDQRCGKKMVPTGICSV
jgi:hypothetical protein